MESHQAQLEMSATTFDDTLQQIDQLHQEEINKIKQENEAIKKNFRNRGEILTYEILLNFKRNLVNKKRLAKEEMIIIPNIFIPDDRANTKQIDHLVLLPTGFYVIETKHWKGHIVIGLTKQNGGKFSFLDDLLGNTGEHTSIFDKEGRNLIVKSDYGNPVTQASGAAWLLRNYIMKKTCIEKLYVKPLAFFNYEGMNLHDWSEDKNVERLQTKDELESFFRDELDKKEWKFSAEQLKSFWRIIKDANYI